jgi:uncharacterized protein
MVAAAAVLDNGELPNAEVLVATTWECNFRCSYCFVKEHSFTAPVQPMSEDTARRIVDALDQGLQHVESICIHLYGGEPLTNIRALRALVEQAEQKPAGRFNFAITTNGSLVSREILELLERGRFQVVLSIDGPPEIHDACRRTVGGQATHARVMAFLRALKASTGCRVRGSAVVRSGWALSDAEGYLRSLPVDVIKAQAVRVPADDPFALSEDERRRYFDDLEAIAETVIAELEDGRVPMDDRFSNRVLQLLAGRSRQSFCGAGRQTFGFTPDGTVLPCVLLDAPANRLGHVTDPTDGWITAGAEWAAARPSRAECHDCTAAPLCGGGCPAIIPVCGADECEIIRQNCSMARKIFEHFRSRPEDLLPLAGIT